jgi:hypothetical protein
MFGGFLMKKTMLFVLVMLTFILCSPALSIAQRTDGQEGSEFKDSSPTLGGNAVEAGLDVGTVFLHADRHSGLDTGIAFGGHVEYFLDDIFALNFAIGYSHHSGATGMHNLFFDIGPRARLPIDPLTPFISISPGFVWQSFGGPVNDSVISFAIDFGSGIDLIVSEKITMGLTYKYHLVFDRDTSFPGVGTADFSSLMLKIDYVF